MYSDLYWLSSATYAIVLFIILLNDIHSGRIRTRLERKYRMMYSWVVFFCIVDTLWGLCNAKRITSDGFFFFVSSCFHLAAVITCFFWIMFVLEYLGKYRKIRFVKIYYGLDLMGILIVLILVVVNCFQTTLFSIENGSYSVGPFRIITFLSQYICFCVIGIITLIFAIRERAQKDNRFFAVFYFVLAPILLGIFQLLYPYAPFYSMGYFFACFIVHIFVVSKYRAANEKNNVLKSIANTYYSMHLIDLEEDTMQSFLQSDILKNLILGTKSAQQMLNQVIQGTCSDEYLNLTMEFCDFSSIQERMKNKNVISSEFIGKNYGWTRISFISVEKINDIQKKIMIVTQIIDEEKKNKIDLIFKSNSDELTGLYNRRAFETDLEENNGKELEENLVFLSMDVNELKIINDTLGHQAGDEMLAGAAACMKECLGAYGKIYRTGGDEFAAILFATKKQLEDIKQDFEEKLMNWSGETVRKVSVSCGYVRKAEENCTTIQELAVLADERMYEEKTLYYREKGIDRRGQKDAHAALCALYTKILKVNLTEDSYQIVNMDIEEKTADKGFSEQISSWLSEFGKSGQVHPDDLENYLAQTNISYLRDYFSRKKNSISVFYRRKIQDEYKQVMMEMIPANDYAEEHQTLYLYVKNIDK